MHVHIFAVTVTLYTLHVIIGLTQILSLPFTFGTYCDNGCCYAPTLRLSHYEEAKGSFLSIKDM